LEQTIALEDLSRKRAFELVDNFLSQIAGLLPQKTS
jgi:hypothetical protein